MAHRRLKAIPGIGPWSAAEVAVRAWGDPDAVSVGDFHLKHLVAFALAGEPRADDTRMLELLEPYAGRRALVDPPAGARRAATAALRAAARPEGHPVDLIGSRPLQSAVDDMSYR